MSEFNYDVERIEELCGKAGIRKPFVYSSWVFMRASGVTKEVASHEIGTNMKQLKRYEDRAEKRLTVVERFELLKDCFLYEYDERIVKVNQLNDMDLRGDTGQ